MKAALALRSGALFLILGQLALLAGDLADKGVFAGALLGAFLIPPLLRGWKFPRERGPRTAEPGRGRSIRETVAGLAVPALLPFGLRILISLPRFFVSGPRDAAAALDGLLLDYDRNAFVFLVPYYWAAFSGYFSLRSRKILRAGIGVDFLVLLLIYSLAHTRDVEPYRWPVLMIAVFALAAFLELAALIRSLPPELNLRRGEGAGAAAALFLLTALGALFFIGPSQEKAVEQGGGLLEPQLFSFDFSKVLKLESEISMNDDLALIVKKDPDDYHILLRRFVLSGYSRDQGFFRVDEYDERDHPQRLPDRTLSLPGREAAEKLRALRITDQEYYLVNFDSQAFIGMNQPVEVVPYRNWDASSFRSVYGVRSLTSDVIPIELINLELWPPSAEKLELSGAEYSLYTGYGGDRRLLEYAGDITQGLEGYWEKVQGIYEWLKYGDYRYSLRAGIAADGDQLGHFLFTSKKGYCSYFAFSFALLLRSLGIPARIGAGFFLDPSTNTFDYYPVRADMAHSWVEVWFPGYGWIEYDPTTENLAEGEEFRISPGVPQELFEKLMREIFGNRGGLEAREGSGGTEGSSFRRGSLAEGVRRYWFPALLCVLVLGWAFFRLGPALAYCLARDRRKKARRLWERAVHLLRLGGLRRPAGTGEAAWARETGLLLRGAGLEKGAPMSGEAAGGGDSPAAEDWVYLLYQGQARARFAPDFGPEDLAGMRGLWPGFIAAYRRAVPLGRRILAWVLPLGPSIFGPFKGGR
ncbi:MAG: transglutaminase-like domain-containing protein [Treponema sp.]|nr:transglutaminase-like domain-containing protein [Treponema sp.]